MENSTKTNVDEIELSVDIVRKRVDEIKKSVNDVFQKFTNDPEVAAIKARKTAEGICKYLYEQFKCELRNNNKPASVVTLDELIRIIEKEKVPTLVISSLRTIQSIGNFATHDQGIENETISSESVESAVKSLRHVASWYLEEFWNEDLPFINESYIQAFKITKDYICKLEKGSEIYWSHIGMDMNQAWDIMKKHIRSNEWLDYDFNVKLLLISPINEDLDNETISEWRENIKRKMPKLEKELNSVCELYKQKQRKFSYKIYHYQNLPPVHGWRIEGDAKLYSISKNTTDEMGIDWHPESYRIFEIPQNSAVNDIDAITFDKVFAENCKEIEIEK